MRKILLFIYLLISNIVSGQNNSINNLKEVNSKKKIYAFIGEKISIENYEIPEKEPEYRYEISPKGDSIKVEYFTINMDNGYKAKYKIIQNIHNEIKTDTIEFIAFDHYGTPHFSKRKNVLLFLVKENGVFFHCKYQYFNVFKTIDNKWAGIYDKSKYGDTQIEPIKIKFKEDVSIELNKYSEKHRYFIYPKKYFKHIDNKVITDYGNYVEDLFKIKKEGVLRARGYFK